MPPNPPSKRAMQIPPLFQKNFEPPPPPEWNPRYATGTGMYVVVCACVYMYVYEWRNERLIQKSWVIHRSQELWWVWGWWRGGVVVMVGWWWWWGWWEWSNIRCRFKINVNREWYLVLTYSRFLRRKIPWFCSNPYIKPHHSPPQLPYIHNIPYNPPISNHPTLVSSCMFSCLTVVVLSNVFNVLCMFDILATRSIYRIHHCVSLCIIVYHCVSLSIIVYHCVSLSIIVYRCLSLCIIVYRCLSSCIIV